MVVVEFECLSLPCFLLVIGCGLILSTDEDFVYFGSFISWTCCCMFQEHENEIEMLVMEREAVKQEQSSLESQLASLRTQIYNLNLEVEEQLAKVPADSYLVYFYVIKIFFFMLSGVG